MSLEPPAISTLASAWSWSKDNIETWCHVMGDLRGVLVKHGPDKHTSLIIAIQFSFFPMFVATLIMIPNKYIQHGGEYGVTNIVVETILAYLFFIVMAIGQRFAAIVVGGKGSFRAAVTLTLFGIAYLPLGCILSYIAVYDNKTARQIYELSGNDYASLHQTRLWLANLVVLAFGVFLIGRFNAATAYVYGVGKVRACVICVLTLAIAVAAMVAFFYPLYDQLLAL